MSADFRTSNMDWCEDNHAVTPYIAEFFNTLSSVPIALFAFHGMIHCLKQRYELRHALLYFCFFVVGVGSCCFHGTLTWQGQAADELPMIWGSSVFLFITLHMRKPDVSITVAILLLAYDVAATILYFSGYYIVFFVLYSLLACPVMYISLIHLKMDTTAAGAVDAAGAPLPASSSLRASGGVKARVVRVISQRSKYLGVIGVSLYMGGFIFFWLPEHLACGNRLFDVHPSIFQKLQFHALFHTTGAIGTYLWGAYACHARMEWMKAHHPDWFQEWYAFSLNRAVKQWSRKHGKQAKMEDAVTLVEVTTAPTVSVLTLGLPLPAVVISPV